MQGINWRKHLILSQIMGIRVGFTIRLCTQEQVGSRSERRAVESLACLDWRAVRCEDSIERKIAHQEYESRYLHRTWGTRGRING